MAERGRPSTYKPTYCDLVIEHMSEGASLTSFAAEIGVARSTINEWMEHNPEFSEAVKIAKSKCAAWWEKLGRSNAITGNGNATLVIFGLKNMGAEDWRDKVEQTVNANVSATVTTVERKIVRPNAVNSDG